MKTDPVDMYLALEWAVKQAAAQSGDPLVRMSILPALKEARDEAKREAGR